MFFVASLRTPTGEGGSHEAGQQLAMFPGSLTGAPHSPATKEVFSLSHLTFKKTQGAQGPRSWGALSVHRDGPGKSARGRGESTLSPYAHNRTKHQARPNLRPSPKPGDAGEGPDVLRQAAFAFHQARGASRTPGPCLPRSRNCGDPIQGQRKQGLPLPMLGVPSMQVPAC